MKDYLNNYNLSDAEINKILLDYRSDIRKMSRINGIFDEQCEQSIMIAIYRKLSRNRKK